MCIALSLCLPSGLIGTVALFIPSLLAFPSDLLSSSSTISAHPATASIRFASLYLFTLSLISLHFASPANSASLQQNFILALLTLLHALRTATNLWSWAGGEGNAISLFGAVTGAVMMGLMSKEMFVGGDTKRGRSRFAR